MFCIKAHGSSVIDVLCLKFSIYVVVNNVLLAVCTVYCMVYSFSLRVNSFLTPTWLLAYT